MQITKTSKLLRFTFIVLILSLSLSLFTSCTAEQEMATKEEIAASISSVTERDAGYHYVHLYLRDMGITNFNASKMLWAELRFQAYFNLNSGLPKTHEHARMTAEMFIADYYDQIDIYDSYEVTNALLTCYVNVIGDQYSIYRTPSEHTEYDNDMSGEFGGIGVVVDYDHENESICVSTVYIGSPAESVGIKVGDYIIGVDGKTIEELGYLNIIHYVRGTIGTDVTVTVKRGDTPMNFTMTRDPVSETTVAYDMLDNDIGLVEIIKFKSNTFEQFVEAIDYLEENGAKGIIFDLRANTGGYVRVVCDIISYLIPSGNTIVTYQYKGTELSVVQSETDVHPTKKDPSDPSKPLEFDHYVTVPMVVLCDEMTASAAEMFTSALRDYSDKGLTNTVTVGHQTYGKGIMQTTWNYYDGSSITITVAYYNSPGGKNFHDVGITPDRIVDIEEVDGVLVDTQFEAAIEEMNTLINNN